MGVSVNFQSSYLVASLSCKTTTTPSSAGHIGHRATENSTLTYDLANLLSPFTLQQWKGLFAQILTVCPISLGLYYGVSCQGLDVSDLRYYQLLVA